jgi:hypothetical protein
MGDCESRWGAVIWQVRDFRPGPRAPESAMPVTVRRPGHHDLSRNLNLAHPRATALTPLRRPSHADRAGPCPMSRGQSAGPVRRGLSSRDPGSLDSGPLPARLRPNRRPVRPGKPVVGSFKLLTADSEAPRPSPGQPYRGHAGCPSHQGGWCARVVHGACKRARVAGLSVPSATVLQSRRSMPSRSRCSPAEGAPASPCERPSRPCRH